MAAEGAAKQRRCHRQGASRFSTRAAASPRRSSRRTCRFRASNRALTTEMAQAVEFILKQHDWKAGGKNDRLPVLRRLDRAGRQLGLGEVLVERAGLREQQGRHRRDRDVQLGLREARDPDRRTARRTGRSRMVSPANTYPGLTTAGRAPSPASRTTTTRPASATTPASCGTTSSRARPTRSSRRSRASRRSTS